MTRAQKFITSEFDKVHLFGALIRETCASVLDDETLAMVELSVIEATNNIVEHAYKEEPGHEVGLSIEVTPEHLMFTLIDRGFSMPEGLLDRNDNVLGFNPKDIPNLPEGGMGLEILKQIMDRVDYSSADGTNTLTMTKNLSGN